MAIATLAGAMPLVAGRLGLSMLAMQVSIGALNDYVDAERDAGQKPGKPIPAGLASRAEARTIAVVAGVAMVVLALPSGVPTTLVAVAGLSLGHLYNLRLARTAWSWLPLALALPLVPMLAWLGSTGTLPNGMLTLLPVAVVAGATLSLANGLVDLERDARSDRPTLAVTLGARQAWLLNALLVVVLAVVAVFTGPAFNTVPPGAEPVLPAELIREVQVWGLWLGIGALGIGSLALRASRPDVRERGWELQAVGVAAVGIAWLAAISAVPGGGG